MLILGENVQSPSDSNMDWSYWKITIYDMFQMLDSKDTVTAKIT